MARRKEAGTLRTYFHLTHSERLRAGTRDRSEWATSEIADQSSEAPRPTRGQSSISSFVCPILFLPPARSSYLPRRHAIVL